MSAMLRLSPEQLKAHMDRMAKSLPVRKVEKLKAHAPVVGGDAAIKAAKYKAMPTAVNGVRFDSKLEAEEWSKLCLLQKAGKIAGLRRQVKFGLFANGGEHIGTYTADFVFDEKGVDGTFKRVVADAKSEHTRTLAAWRRTKKLMLACHGVDVREVP